MKRSTRLISLFTQTVLLLFAGAILSGQKKGSDDKALRADMYKSKKSAIEFLSDSSVVRRFGMIADSIWRFAEPGMQEFRSSAILARVLEREGFTIERNVAGMPTCFIATWGTGKPVIGILGEFDALPRLSQRPITPYQEPLVPGAPGHACGHNLMGTAGAAAAIAVKRSMKSDNIQGTIKFYGTPAEETLIGKAYMVREGVFADVDAVIDNHSSSEMETGYGVSGNAVMSVMFSFKGKTAHAAAAPWSGRSALDAVELMDVATNYLREHLNNTHRLHYIITDGGAAPNIVPDRATVWYYLRETDERLEEMYKRVIDCARGAALATGTTLDTIKIIAGIHQKHSNKGLAVAIQRNIDLIGMPQWSESETAFAKALQKNLGAEEKGYNKNVSPMNVPSGVQTGGASTDVGDVSLVAPTATLNFPGVPPGVVGHHWSTVASAYGSAAWKGLNAGAKVMASTALDLLTKPEILEAIKIEFAGYSQNHPYKSFLPAGTKPPLDLNRDLVGNQ